MGRYASQLHRRLASKPNGLLTKDLKKSPGEPLPVGVADIETLIKKGHDPIHAAYVSMQQLSSLFAEGVAELSEMKSWAGTVEKAATEYRPDGPPISPLTRSYFWLWALYDLCIGKSADTLGHCQIAANDLIQMNVHQLEALKNLAASRMGIYEHIGFEGPHIRLRELFTNEHLICHCTSGYQGNEGELWYVRLVPPLEPEVAIYWVSMTTPYVLLGASKADWTAFLKRTVVQLDRPNERTRLHYLLKYGLSPNYWNEFVFTAFHHYQFDAVFLTGIPDVKASLPHA